MSIASKLRAIFFVKIVQAIVGAIAHKRLVNAATLLTVTLELCERVTLTRRAIGGRFFVRRVTTIVLGVAAPRQRYARAIGAFELSGRVTIQLRTIELVAKVKTIEAAIAPFLLGYACAIATLELVAWTKVGCFLFLKGILI